MWQVEEATRLIRHNRVVGLKSKKAKQHKKKTKKDDLQDFAVALLGLLLSTTASASAAAAEAAAATVELLSFFFCADCRVDRKFKHLVHTAHLLAAALDVRGAHTLGHRLSLLRRDGGEALGLEQLDAGTLCAEVGFETNKDQGGGGTEVEYFRVPLFKYQRLGWITFSGYGKSGTLVAV